MKILNVGAGNENFGNDFVDKYPTRYEVIRCDIDAENLPFQDNSFDVVYSKNLFEHIKNPNLVLCRMIRVLKKGGKIILITDNAGYLFHHIDLSNISSNRASHQKAELYHSFGKEDKHFSLFTPLHLRNHFSDLKLRKIRTEYIFNRSFTWKNNILFYFCNLLYKSKFFKPIAYPRIKIQAIK